MAVLMASIHLLKTYIEDFIMKFKNCFQRLKSISLSKMMGSIIVYSMCFFFTVIFCGYVFGSLGFVWVVEERVRYE